MNQTRLDRLFLVIVLGGVALSFTWLATIEVAEVSRIAGDLSQAGQAWFDPPTPTPGPTEFALSRALAVAQIAPAAAALPPTLVATTRAATVVRTADPTTVPTVGTTVVPMVDAEAPATGLQPERTPELLAEIPEVVVAESTRELPASSVAGSASADTTIPAVTTSPPPPTSVRAPAPAAPPQPAQAVAVGAVPVQTRAEPPPPVRPLAAAASATGTTTFKPAPPPPTPIVHRPAKPPKPEKAQKPDRPSHPSH